MDRRTKAQQIRQTWLDKIKKEEEDFKADHIFPIVRRQRSCFNLKGKYQRCTILAESGMYDAHKFFLHPTNTYKKFVKEHASNDFAKLREEAGDDDIRYRYLRRQACKKIKQHMRVNSQFHPYSCQKKYMELKPKVRTDLEEICDLMFNVKIVDMGNACYIDRHYSDIIQTREYRSPEVILEGEYDTSADIWSLACMVFEMVTGDYLFDPKKGKTYTKNDDHLASIMELIGPCTDRNFLNSCEAAGEFFDKKNKLKRVKKLKEWRLHDILVEKYRLKDTEALFLARFLERCIKWNPKDRASAQDLLSDPWIMMQPRYDARMDPGLYNEFMQIRDPEHAASDKTPSLL